MREPRIDPQDLETWAAILLDHSIGGVTPEDRVMIKGERICWPLMEVLERRVLEAGGVPDVLLVPPNNDRGRVFSAAMGSHGSAVQAQRVPEWHLARYQSMTKYVEVLGAEDPSRFSRLRPEAAQRVVAADQPFMALRLSKPWVITLFPTPGFAALEGIDLDEYTNFLVRASTVDPRPLKAAEDRIAPLFDDARAMTVVTTHPSGRELTLRLDLSPSRAALSYGLRNFPDGEVFTSPDARRTEGEIFVDLPVMYGGRDIRGIHLRFEGGLIVEYSAQEGHEALATIIETDQGSHRLGEVALGMNPGLTRVLKHPLLVEKVGGTLHIAIGSSYDHCYKDAAAIAELKAQGVLNVSAQHVDIVSDFRPGGCGRRVLFDDREVVVRDGAWVPA
jgi:aminopeptidase